MLRRVAADGFSAAGTFAMYAVRQRLERMKTDDIFPNVVAVKALHVGAGADESKVFLIGVVAFAFFGGMGRVRKDEQQGKERGE